MSIDYELKLLLNSYAGTYLHHYGSPVMHEIRENTFQGIKALLSAQGFCKDCDRNGECQTQSILLNNGNNLIPDEWGCSEFKRVSK